MAWPCQIQSFQKGEEAIGFLKQTTPWPVLILLDHHLPGFSGMEVLGQLRELRAGQQTLIVLMSGEAPPSFTPQIQQAGGNGHLIKPPTLAGWQRALRQIIRSLSNDYCLGC